jgi:hypothetical protein
MSRQPEFSNAIWISLVGVTVYVTWAVHLIAGLGLMIAPAHYVAALSGVFVVALCLRGATYLTLRLFADGFETVLYDQVAETVLPIAWAIALYAGAHVRPVVFAVGLTLFGTAAIRWYRFYVSFKAKRALPNVPKEGEPTPPEGAADCELCEAFVKAEDALVDVEKEEDAVLSEATRRYLTARRRMFAFHENDRMWRNP